MQTWTHKVKKPPGRRPGRPPHTKEVRAEALLVVEAEWRRQGTSSGEGTVYRALRGQVSRTLVRESLKVLKATKKKLERARIEKNRVHIDVHARDVLWSQDATELVRDPAPSSVTSAVSACVEGDVDVNGDFRADAPSEPQCSKIEGPGCLQDRRSMLGWTCSTPLDDAFSGSAQPLASARAPSASRALRCEVGQVQHQAKHARRRRRPQSRIVTAEVIRDVASTRTLSIDVGAPARHDDVIAELERTARERGTWPLVYVTDRGAPYRAKEVQELLRKHKVVHLFSEPHTPQHNPWVEHGHRELKEEAGIASLPRSVSPGELAAELERARYTIDHCRLRRSRDWRTAVQYELALPHARDVGSRARFYESACRATARAVEGSPTARERRRGEREAVFATLELYGFITRSRGGVRIRAPESAAIS